MRRSWQVEEEISLEEAARIAQTLGLVVPPMVSEADDDDDIVADAAGGLGMESAMLPDKPAMDGGAPTAPMALQCA
jgi:hypothetical protein